MRQEALRAARGVAQITQKRSLSSSSAPRHLLTIDDLSPSEFTKLVLNASAHKNTTKLDMHHGRVPQSLHGKLTGRTVAMMFSKRSTRTRVSTEAAVALMGGHSMFLGKDDIQLGVNESLLDTSIVISSMTQCMVARVGSHSEVAELAQYSSVPVINALSDDFHPLQAIADFQTIHEFFSDRQPTASTLGLEGLKIAWVGDSNNVLFDLAIACVKMGVDICVASPDGYGIPKSMRQLIDRTTGSGKLTETTVPEEAIKDANVLVTDTWVSMGQERETQKRLKAFSGYQITNELATRGGAHPDWKFMHCLPRHPQEVADEVFYSDRSLVFAEAENRLWAAAAVLEAFVANKGRIV